MKLDIQRYTIRARAASLFPPIWLSWASASVPNSRVVDAVASRLSENDILKITKSYDLVVIQADSSIINYCIYLAERIKSESGALICFVGPHVTVLADETLRASKCIDFIARREYDYTIRDLAEGKEPSKILGISRRENDRIIHNPDRPLIENLDELPFVNPIYKRDLPIKAYGIHELFHPFTTIFSSRGCPYGCRYYCRWPAVFEGSRYRMRSPSNVYEEMLWIKENMKEVKEILFDEDTFGVFPKRVKEICKLLEPLDLTWSCNARATLSLDVLEAMRRAGCRLLIVGFESGSPDILRTIRKGVTVDMMKQFAENCHKVGLLIHGCFQVGLPGETPETLEKTFKLALELDCDSIQFSVASPYPGTDFYKFLKENGYLKSDAYVDERGFQQAVYDYPGLSSADICQASEDFHKRYIFRSHYMLKLLRLAISDKREAKRILRGVYHYASYLMARFGL
ncbi:MAG: radical SAM protein [Nitrososphaerota archaeon]